MRTFNTSGPNIPAQHYTISRQNLIDRGIKLVTNDRYFTIWAPRQTGKSTYFRLLATELAKQGYQVAHINFENYKDESKEAFLGKLRGELQQFWHIDFSNLGIGEIFYKLECTKDRKLVLIIDEIEGLNPDYLHSFLHAIRAAYHSRTEHSLKSVILVGVANITGDIEQHASPFNTNDNLQVPYFTKEEIYELLKMHEDETGQLFSPKVKEKIAYITAGQPGLVNGFGYNLVEHYPTEKIFQYEQYLEIEKNYTSIYIDKNVSNIINKGKKYRKFIERLLFDENKIPFEIYDDRIKFLSVNGLISYDTDKNIIFHVPLYKKCLQVAFGPPMNGESEKIKKNIEIEDYFSTEKGLNIDKIIRNYQAYAKKRGFRYFIQKDENGNPTGLIEAALVHSFDTYIQSFLQVFEGKSYLEPHVALGRSDLIVNIQGTEFVIEAKIFRDSNQFKKGKIQLAYYISSLGLTTGVYLVFADTETTNSVLVEESQLIENVQLTTYIVRYDVEKDFNEDLRKTENRAKRTYKKKE